MCCAKHTVLFYVNFSNMIAPEDYPKRNQLLRLEQIEDFNRAARVVDV
jgi:hypothetical protein